MKSQESLDRVFDEVVPRIVTPDVSEIRNGSIRRARQRARAKQFGVTMAVSALVVASLVTLTRDEPSSVATGAEDGESLVEVPSADPVSGDDAAPTMNELEFFESLQRGRWKLAEGSDTFPDRDVPEQGIAFWTQAEPSDRVGFYGLGCFTADAFLRWDEPGVASVVPDETGMVILKPAIRCEASPGIGNYPAEIGSSLHVKLDGDFADVELYDPAGVELWTARFEYDQYHLLDVGGDVDEDGDVVVEDEGPPGEIEPVPSTEPVGQDDDES